MHVQKSSFKDSEMIQTETEPSLDLHCPLRKHVRAIFSKFLKTEMKTFDIFLIFAQNIDCGYTSEPVLTSTKNLCLKAKIRKIIPL